MDLILGAPRRRWARGEKLAAVAATFLPGMTVTSVRAQRVLDWFKPLNPYEGHEGQSILRTEKENFHQTDKRSREPLYCYAVSAKRYALFNIKDGKAVIRKASAHGLGFWRAPFSAPEGWKDTGTHYWQAELWRLICQAALDGRDSDGFSLHEDERFGSTAAGQTTISKWQFFKWFDKYNTGRDYRDSVQPFNFLLRLPTKKRNQIDPEGPEFSAWCDQYKGEPSLIAPFDTDTDAAAKRAFHRDPETGDVETELDYSPWLINFADVLDDYDLHPEAKFIGGHGLNSGELSQRHVYPHRILQVGKESHEWEENEALGLTDDAEVRFGEALPSAEEMQRVVKDALLEGRISSNELSRRAKVSKTTVGLVRYDKLAPGKSIEKMFRIVVETDLVD